MKITTSPGSKGKGDKIIKVTTEKEEAIAIIKLCCLVNILSENEYRVNKEKILKKEKEAKESGEEKDCFFFKQAINEAIDKGRRGIILRKWFNDKGNLKDFCKRYQLMKLFDKQGKEVLNDFQLNLEEFENEDRN